MITVTIPTDLRVPRGHGRCLIFRLGLRDDKADAETIVNSTSGFLSLHVCSSCTTTLQILYNGLLVRRVFRGSIRRCQHLSTVPDTYRALPTSIDELLASFTCREQRTGCPLYGLQLFDYVCFSVRRTSCPSRFRERPVYRAAVATDWKSVLQRGLGHPLAFPDRSTRLFTLDNPLAPITNTRLDGTSQV